ncbi:MAG: class I SAM-dependent methyltransferase [Erysipelotrichaceae bacterium]|nr:class I SAM-dependent methyltransferase [Erysipelotrichaceae bacterium]
MNRKEQIENAYALSKGMTNFYDGMMTCSTPLGRLICKVIWNTDKEKNTEYITKALSALPEDFSGRMLEVPVGTGILTMPLYQGLPKADITCLDYSEDMMASAKEKAKAFGIQNITFLQGDVGALPFDSNSFDLVLSLNGFHAFPDKEKAYREILRVLKPGGIFCGCFYIKGECRRTDWLIQHLYTPLGYFTPPFETKESLTERLEKNYTDVSVQCVEGISCFCCRK